MKFDVFEVNFIFMFLLFLYQKKKKKKVVTPHNYPKERCLNHPNLFLKALLGVFSPVSYISKNRFLFIQNVIFSILTLFKSI